MDLNPRYLTYSRVHGMGPDEMLAHDRSRYRGGCMTGYIIWVQEQVTAFARVHGVSRTLPRLSDIPNLGWEEVNEAFEGYLDVLPPIEDISKCECHVRFPFCDPAHK